MIQLTRINRVPLIVNSDLIEHIESTPDTVVSLTSGQRFVVLESADEIIEKVKSFRRAILAPIFATRHEEERQPHQTGESNPQCPNHEH